MSDDDSASGQGESEGPAGDDAAADGPETIDEKVARVEAIIDRLESGDPDLSEAKTLRDEGRELIADLREVLEADEGDVLESERTE